MANQHIVLLSDSSTQSNKMVTWREAIALQISNHFDFEIEKTRGKLPFISVNGASFGQHSSRHGPRSVCSPMRFGSALA